MSLNRLSSFFKSYNGSATAAPQSNGEADGTKTQKGFQKTTPHLTFEQSSLSATLDFIRHREAIDDRKLALEHGLTKLSKMEPGENSQKLQDLAIELLYNDLSHPPATAIGNKYAWRAADGSNNNIDDPNMGKAGTTYARSVQQSHPLSPRELPDPGLIFDTLLRRDGFVRHPAGLSSLMFSFAALVIHTVFRTSHRDVTVNETSSYVDLSPLYGHNQEAQDKVRMRDGRGFLYPDVFAEDRLLLLPPAVCVLLVLFSRNHNYIARKLFEINERGTFKDPLMLSGDKLLAQEEELFQTARLINCGWFGSVVFSDYLSCILGLVRQGSSWSLNPFGEIRKLDHSLFERGRGNVCSVEFNCLYRWHATTSVEDEQWVVQLSEQLFDGKNPETLTLQDFQVASKKAMSMSPDIQHWTFGELQRQADGTFKDEDLANLLKNATEHPAGAFRARGTPGCMKINEIMGIEQNRKWGVCSLNDFRKYLGLKPYGSFKEWNSDPEIADAAEKLYGDIDYLELYVGLQAEEAKPVVEGAGLCPGYTISRAILSDAIALTRGDRYFTHDYTPFNLTAWGFADCQRDPDAFGFGSTLGRLFLRTLPGQYTKNSSYAFFPLMTPDAMKVYLKDLNVLDQYDTERPSANPVSQKVEDYAQVGDIINAPEFIAHYEERASQVIKGKGFFSAPETREEQRKVLKALVDSPESEAELCKFFYTKTRELIQSRSFTLSGSQTHAVDIVRDVLKEVPIYWVADMAGIQLKTSASGQGDFTPSELFDILSDIYTYIFLDVELSKLMVLQFKVEDHIKKLTQHIQNAAGTSSRRISVMNLFYAKSKKTEQHDFVKRLHAIGQTVSEQTNNVLAIMVGSVEMAVAFTNMVNLYLGSSHEAEIRSVLSDPKGDLSGYVLESLRLDPTFKGVHRIATADLSMSGLSVRQHSRLFLDIYAACQNEQAFPDPKAVNIKRNPTDRYIVTDGIARCLGQSLTVKIMSQVLRALFEIESLKRAPGQSGVLKRFQNHGLPELYYAYLDERKSISPWPTTMAVQYTA